MINEFLSIRKYVPPSTDWDTTFIGFEFETELDKYTIVANPDGANA
jgi:hypothetical protein